MNQIRTRIIASLVFFCIGVVFFSMGVQKYQVLTSSRASISWGRCERNIDDTGDKFKNVPCSGCLITGTTIDENGIGAVTFSCELYCKQTNTADFQGCPTDEEAPGFHIVSDTSWAWCKTAGTDPCPIDGNNSGPDVIKTSAGPAFYETPFNIPNTGTTNFNGSFSIADYTNCGRVQTDVALNGVIGGYVYDTGQDCVPPTDTPTPPPVIDTPSITPSPTNTLTPTVTLTPTQTPTGTLTPTNTPTITLTPTDSPTPTDTPTSTPSKTPTPTKTPTATPTPTIPTNTPVPTDTPIPTDTPVPTETPLPTDTPIATNTPVPQTPAPSLIAQNPPTEVPTPTPQKQIAVNEQKPGLTPWAMILAPLGLILLGLFL